jgi:hypothetical protein
MLYLKAFEKEITKFTKIMNIFVIIFGIVCGSISFALTAKEIYFAMMGTN